MTDVNPQDALEIWLNADAEMRFAEIGIGEEQRWFVRLFQIETEKPHPDEASRAEGGTLDQAINAALQKALENRVRAR